MMRTTPAALALSPKFINAAYAANAALELSLKLKISASVRILTSSCFLADENKCSAVASYAAALMMMLHAAAGDN